MKKLNELQQSLGLMVFKTCESSAVSLWTLLLHSCFLYWLWDPEDFKSIYYTTAASLSRTEEILPDKYKRSKARTSKRVGVFASSLWKCTIFLLPYSFSISYGSFFYLQWGKGNYIMPMHFTRKHSHKQCSVINNLQIYIIYSISFLLNSEYTYEVPVLVDIYDFQDL